MQPLIYANIIQVISTQINDLNTYFKTGIELKIHSSFVNNFSFSSFRWYEKWTLVSIKMQTLDNNCQTKRIRVIVMLIVIVPFSFFDDKYYNNNCRHLYFCHNDKSFRFFSNNLFAVNLYFAILRIFIHFGFGENVLKSFSQLKNILEELSLKTNFSNDDWKQWIAIKAMEKELNFTLFNTLKLKRKTAITVCSFIQ
jgi:hypothetical protein